MIRLFVFLYSCVCVCGIGLFHEESRISFQPNLHAIYFGFSVSLSETGLTVGAPRAMNINGNSSGLVFDCSTDGLDDLDDNIKQCYTNSLGGKRYRSVLAYGDLFKHDMWFGATLAKLSKSKLLICAPRWFTTHKSSHYLEHGACFLHIKEKNWVLYPFKDKDRQAVIVDKTRKDYGPIGTHLGYYAYSQAGMSLKVTDDNKVIIGAPGLLQWTGGFVIYEYSPIDDYSYISQQTTTNPFYTPELQPYSYFGYSVESGVFETKGSNLYVGGAPRGSNGYGQVLIFKAVKRERDPLNIFKNIKGPHLGSYFGASLCCTDIDGDGRSDLLVGAPTYVNKDGGLRYNQGAVFVYMTRGKDDDFILEETGHVLGSEADGAQFGTAIAELGDIDGDGYKDIAIGAPWENDGAGAVYIYRGHKNGLKKTYSQRIYLEDAKGFGISISKGYDVDKNNCNDVAIGALRSGEVFLFKCIPTVDVFASIDVPDAINLPINATEFVVSACILMPDKPLSRHVKVHLKSKIIVDPELNRAQVVGDEEALIIAKPGDNTCTERTISVKSTADMSRPILIKHEVTPEYLSSDSSSKFPKETARISEESTVNASFLLQILRDCGDDLVCTPWLEMTMEPMTNPYIPGTDAKLGFKLKVRNTKEPAYGAKVNIILPSTPKRVPSECSLQQLNMTCDVPAPLLRNLDIIWEIELEYTDEADLLIVQAELVDSLYRKVTDDENKELIIEVKPVANFSVAGDQLPNATISVSREKLYNGEPIYFTHFYKITNYGPSNWHMLDADVTIPEKVDLSDLPESCQYINLQLECGWSVPARVSVPILLNLRFNLSNYGEALELNTTMNLTTKIVLRLKDQNRSLEITTTFILEPEAPIWPQILGSVVGILVLAAIVLGLNKAGFFSRKQRDQMKLLQDQSQSEEETEHDNSARTSELFNEYSD